MKFDDIKKVWDTQNKEPLYVIDKEAMHRHVRSKRNRMQFVSNLNEYGLVAIAVLTSLYLAIKNWDIGNTYTHLPWIFLLGTAVYVLWKRVKRKEQEARFDESIMGDLNHAISNMNFEINRAKTFMWWYISPLLASAALKMYMNGASASKWVIVLGMFVLAFVVVRLSLILGQLPQRKALERMKEKLIQLEEE